MALVRSRSKLTGAFLVGALGAGLLAVMWDKEPFGLSEETASPVEQADVAAALATDEVGAVGAAPSVERSAELDAPNIAIGVEPVPQHATLDQSAVGGEAAVAPLPKLSKEQLERRRLSMTGPAHEIEAARSSDRIGTFRTDRPHIDVVPKPSRESIRVETQGVSDGDGIGGTVKSVRDAAPAPEPIEFIIKLKDPKLVQELRDLYAKSPAEAERRLKENLVGGRLIQLGRLQGFTLGGEAIVKWPGPAKMSDYGLVHDALQRVLNASPSVAYAEQNFTADLHSVQ